MQFTKDEENHNNIMFMKVFSALLFAVSSLMITVVNKTILSVYKFPSYQALALGQMVATVVFLWIARRLLLVQLPPLGCDVARRIWPLPLVFLGNLATGLGGTKELSMPMFTVLRRLSIPMTMILEKLILRIEASCAVQFSVIGMVVGALVAAADDLSFTWTGYNLILLNDAFSAANGVYLKKILDAKDLDMMGLLYYDSFLMIIPAAIVAWSTGDLYISTTYVKWTDITFLYNFLISCWLGVVVSYSVMLCTKYNSALTTSVIGSLKNIIATYLGMVMMDDYVYSWFNFVGLNISVIASLVYTYITFKEKSAPITLTSNPSDNTVR